MLGFLKKILKKIGPGFVTGAADDDPSVNATYSQTVAIFSFRQLWLTLFSFNTKTAEMAVIFRE